MSIIIETKNLTKKFGDFIANNNINIQVEKQEIKCIVGENGAGKSTLMNMLYGVHKPTSGKILLNGKELVMNSLQMQFEMELEWFISISNWYLA